MFMCTGVNVYILNKSKWFLTQKKKYMYILIWLLWDFNYYIE